MNNFDELRDAVIAINTRLTDWEHNSGQMRIEVDRLICDSSLLSGDLSAETTRREMIERRLDRVEFDGEIPGIAQRLERLERRLEALEALEARVMELTTIDADLSETDTLRGSWN